MGLLRKKTKTAPMGQGMIRLEGTCRQKHHVYHVGYKNDLSQRPAAPGLVWYYATTDCPTCGATVNLGRAAGK